MLGLPWRFGSDSFAVRVEAVGCRNGEPVRVECQVSGRREADITAKVAAATAAAVYTSAYPRGVFHIEQLFALQDVLPHVEDALSVELRMNGSRVLF